MPAPPGFDVERKTWLDRITKERVTIGTALVVPEADATSISRRTQVLIQTTERPSGAETYFASVSGSLSLSGYQGAIASRQVNSAAVTEVKNRFLALLTGEWGPGPTAPSDSGLDYSGATYRNPTSGETIEFLNKRVTRGSGQAVSQQQILTVSGAMRIDIPGPAPAGGPTFIEIGASFSASGSVIVPSRGRGVVATDAKLTTVYNYAFARADGIAIRPAPAAPSNLEFSRGRARYYDPASLPGNSDMPAVS